MADIFVPPMPALPDPGELRATDDFVLDSGGCAANVAAALARLGVPASVTGRVGRDLFGDFVIDHLRAAGVDTDAIRRSDTLGTAKTVVLTVAGEDRRFVHTFGANAEFSAGDIDIGGIVSGDVLYLGGLLVMPSVDAGAAAALFRAARERGAVTVLDVVVPAGDAAGAMEQLERILPHTDYFTPNEAEARVLTGETDSLEQARRFRAAGCGAVLLTRGRHGTLLVTEKTCVEAGVYAVDFVDGSGAGDAFAAGWIAGLLEGWPLVDTLRFASAVGASACTRLGCTTGVFTRQQALEFVAARTLELNETMAIAPE
ncbi:MAG TPA: carbohydrate kinase family protein [Chthonomonadaceae bacterium]|nr:carbohydrate kinase family protein [Chthonomonadaceae bacterium]